MEDIAGGDRESGKGSSDCCRDCQSTGSREYQTTEKLQSTDIEKGIKKNIFTFLDRSLFFFFFFFWTLSQPFKYVGLVQNLIFFQNWSPDWCYFWDKPVFFCWQKMRERHASPHMFPQFKVRSEIVLVSFCHVRADFMHGCSWIWHQKCPVYLIGNFNHVEFVYVKGCKFSRFCRNSFFHAVTIPALLREYTTK